MDDPTAGVAIDTADTTIRSALRRTAAPTRLSRRAAQGAGARQHPHAAIRVGLAVGATGVALATRVALDPVLPPGFPYVTFLPAVILTAFVLGWKAGAVCAVLSGIAAWYFFIPPAGSLMFDGPTALALAFFAVIVTVDITLIHLMQAADAELRREQSTTAQLYDQQRTMFQELQHRVANNMQFVAAILTLQRRRVGEDPGAALDALDQARARLETVGRIHRRLYDPTRLSQPVGEHLRDLCADLVDAASARDVVCRVEAAPVRLDLTRLTTLSLFVSEIVTNALKHAFEPGRGGTITVDLAQVDAATLALTIQDDGRGTPAGFDPEAARSLGLRITQGLAAQLAGTVRYAGGPGTAVRLTFPVLPAP